MFDGTAEEAMNFYVSLIPNSRVLTADYYGEEDAAIAGKLRQGSFELAGQAFICIDTPIKHDFTFTPSISIFVDCESEAELERLFSKLGEGGEVLMPLDDYGFSERFGWVSDRFGVSWQLNLPSG